MHSIAAAAISKGTVQIIETLIAHGADITAQDRDGNTPLHLAAADDSSEAGAAVIALLNAGANALR